MIKFYKNKNDGSILTNLDVLSDDYEELIPNTVDATLEKHLPVYEVKGTEILVKVGKNFHPMEENHYIMWIACINNDRIEKIYLNPGDIPEAIFSYVKGAEIYAYCNIHGLWKNIIE